MVDKLAKQFKDDLLKQPRRLRTDMPESSLRTWIARTLMILGCFLEVSYLKKRLEEINDSRESILDEVSQIKELLNSVIDSTDSQLFGTGKEIAIPNMLAGQRVTFAPIFERTKL